MLQYDWGNSSNIMISGDEPGQEGDPTSSIFDYSISAAAANGNQDSYNEIMVPHHQSGNVNTSGFIHPSHFQSPAQTQAHNQSIYNARAYSTASAYDTPQASFLELGGSSGCYFLVPKTEELAGDVEFSSRIGLNLGGRTYFSSAEDDFVSRLSRRSRPGDVMGPINTPRCQAEGCNADLAHAKHYHRRHKVCEYHSKAPTVVAAGLTQRFCQQCSRFHLLSEFDNDKRSCRRRLADHNRRRRKSQPKFNLENQTSLSEIARTSSSDTLTRSPVDSGIHSPSSGMVAVSPPRMSLDCFPQWS